MLTPENLAKVFNIKAVVEYDERTKAFNVTILGTIPKEPLKKIDLTGSEVLSNL